MIQKLLLWMTSMMLRSISRYARFISAVKSIPLSPLPYFAKCCNIFNCTLKALFGWDEKSGWVGKGWRKSGWKMSLCLISKRKLEVKLDARVFFTQAHQNIFSPQCWENERKNGLVSNITFLSFFQLNFSNPSAFNLLHLFTTMLLFCKCKHYQMITLLFFGFETKLTLLIIIYSFYFILQVLLVFSISLMKRISQLCSITCTIADCSFK